MVPLVIRINRVPSNIWDESTWNVDPDNGICRLCFCWKILDRENFHFWRWRRTREIETCGHVGTDEFSLAKVLFLVADVKGPTRIRIHFIYNFSLYESPVPAPYYCDNLAINGDECLRYKRWPIIPKPPARNMDGTKGPLITNWQQSNTIVV